MAHDGDFNQLWLDPGSRVSFHVKQGRYCVGHTSLTTIKDTPRIRWQSCLNQETLKKGWRCSSCYRADVLRPCVRCNGTTCRAAIPLQQICRQATAYVYLASFGVSPVKVGVAHWTRFPQRWIEQGANLAKRILIGTGRDVRRFEHTLHRTVTVISGLSTEKKVDTLWKTPKTETEVKGIEAMEREIKKRFPTLSFYQEACHNLLPIYDLPPLDRKPIEVKLCAGTQVSGDVIGVKGSLLLLKVQNLIYYLNLKHLLGRIIELNENSPTVLQTTLD